MIPLSVLIVSPVCNPTDQACKCLGEGPFEPDWRVDPSNPLVAGTCFDFPGVVARSPYASALVLARYATKLEQMLAGLHGEVVGGRLVSQKDPDQTQGYRSVEPDGSEWVILDEGGLVIARIGSTKDPLGPDAIQIDDDGDPYTDLLLHTASGALWVARGPFDPKLLLAPPQ